MGAHDIEVIDEDDEDEVGREGDEEGLDEVVGGRCSSEASRMGRFGAGGRAIIFLFAECK